MHLKNYEKIKRHLLKKKIFFPFAADEFFVSRARHVPDELELLPPTFCDVGNAGSVALERRQETTAMVRAIDNHELKIKGEVMGCFSKNY